MSARREREAFDLTRIQDLTQPEAAEVLGISESTLRRRLRRGVLLLTEQLSDLEPSNAFESSASNSRTKMISRLDSLRMDPRAHESPGDLRDLDERIGR